MSSLREAQTQVRNFHRATGSTIGEWPEIRDWQLRKDLIAEEAAETIRALREGDLVEVADGIADLIYVALGTAVACGIDIEDVWQEVHRSNMAKVGGPKRADGKAGKPEGWKPPDIASIIEQQAFRALAEEMDRALVGA